MSKVELRLREKLFLLFQGWVLMSIIYQLPALLRVALVFVIILLVIRKNLSLGSAFLIGSLVLGLLFGMNAEALVASVVSAVLYPKTLVLVVIVTLILILSDSMEKAGQMARLLGRFQGLIGNARLNLVIFPALIGLLPMPGGAVFSAPMVKELGRNSNLDGQQLSFVNYWFRHIWEYWWPMYPGVLLTAIVADVNLLSFVPLMFPLSIAAVYLGRHPLRAMDLPDEASAVRKRPSLWPFLREMLPILIVIFPGIGLGVLFFNVFPAFPTAKESGLVLSLCVAVGWTWYENSFSPKRIWQTLRNPQLIKMMVMVFSILIFKEILGDSRGVAAISDELTMLHVPLVLIAIFLPFIVGTLTGITIAFVGSTFPIIVPLIHSHGEAQFLLAYVMIALVSGFAGVLLSPLHLCLILSNEYFDTPTGPVYRHLWRPCIYLVCVGFVYFWVLYALLGL